MKRWPIAILLLSLFASAESCAQGAAPGAGTAARPDSTRQGLHFIYMVRHGWYNADDPRDERIGKGLDSLGRQQARLTGERLAALPIHVDRLVSSTFTRAAQTADDIGAILHTPVVRDSDLCECQPISARDDYNRMLQPGESDACIAQLERAYARYFTPSGTREDRHDVLVAHGNVTRWLLTRALGIDSKRWSDFAIGNGSISAFVVRPDGSVSLAAWSDTGHLPANLQTWTARGAGWSPPPPRRNAAAAPAMTPSRGVSMPASAAARDTLKYSRPTHR